MIQLDELISNMAGGPFKAVPFSGAQLPSPSLSAPLVFPGALVLWAPSDGRMMKWVDEAQLYEKVL